MKTIERRRLPKELSTWFEYIFSELGREERRTALGNYVSGLLLEGDRKSLQPMAQRMAPNGEAEAWRQRMQQAVTVAEWDDSEVFKRIAKRVVEEVPEIEAFVIDDTGFPKKGFKSVGVQRQYSGTMGRIDNCQIATSLHLASDTFGACIGMKLYLPISWASDEKRRKKTGVPDEIIFEEKWKQALRMLDEARAWGLPDLPVVMDAAYGEPNEMRVALRQRKMKYVVGISKKATAWPPGVTPIPPPKKVPNTNGRPPTRWRIPDSGPPTSLEELADKIPREKFKNITWRVGTKGKQSGRFAAVRIRMAHGHQDGKPPNEEEWLLLEWPHKQDKPSAFYLSNLPLKTSLKRIVYIAKLRWRIERDYQEMKSELGLDHFEGRGFRGFHHHVTCVATAHAFLTVQKAKHERNKKNS
jgi:SRSO17 transposase